MVGRTHLIAEESVNELHRSSEGRHLVHIVLALDHLRDARVRSRLSRIVASEQVGVLELESLAH